MISIDAIAVKNGVADNVYQRSELDYLFYNAPLCTPILYYVVISRHPKGSNRIQIARLICTRPRPAWGVVPKILHLNVLDFAVLR